MRRYPKTVLKAAVRTVLVTVPSQTVKLYPGTVQLSQAQQTQQTLGAGSCCAGWCSWPWTPRRSGRSGYRR
jgi:hypothetical protein